MPQFCTQEITELNICHMTNNTIKKKRGWKTLQTTRLELGTFWLRLRTFPHLVSPLTSLCLTQLGPNWGTTMTTVFKSPANKPRVCMHIQRSSRLTAWLTICSLLTESVLLFYFSLPVSSLLGTKVLRRPIHSLEINTVKNFDFAGRTFLVTGSEDTKMKIFDAGAPTFCRFRNVATLTSHISSVKCVDVVVDDSFVLVVSAGGRAQVRDLQP